MNLDDEQKQGYGVTKAQVKASFNQAAEHYDDRAILQQEVCNRLLERLDYIKVQPKVILDIGTGTGQGLEGLSRRYPDANIIALDLAENMLLKNRSKLTPRGLLGSFKKFIQAPAPYHYVCADAESLPLLDASVDLVFSSLTLQWCQDLHKLFLELRRVLKPGGCLLFTTFGPDTLKELRKSWATVSDKIHVNRFADMHDIGDALYQAQTENPVMDTEIITLNFQSVRDILLELKTVGAHNQNVGREKGLTGKKRFKAMYQAYEQFHTQAGYPVTYEVVYGHAWNPLTPLQQTCSVNNQQQTSINLAQLKKTLQK